MSYEVRKGLNIYYVETYRDIISNRFYFNVEQSCICPCGNEHTNIVYDSDEDDLSYHTEIVAIDAGEKYINENEEL